VTRKSSQRIRAPVAHWCCLTRESANNRFIYGNLYQPAAQLAFEHEAETTETRLTKRRRLRSFDAECNRERGVLALAL
jgi:hypothetical protein